MPLPPNYRSSGAARTRQGARVQFSSLYRHDVVNAVAVDDNGYKTTIAGPNTTTIIPTLDGALVTAGEGRPDIPRNVVITVTHASAVVALSGTISGFADAARRVPITEAWSVTAGGTSKVFTGKKSFAIVTKVTITAAGDATADSVIIGTGKVFGFPVKVACPSAVKELSGGSIATNGVVVAASTASTDDQFGTYTPNAAPDGNTDFVVWVIVDSPSE